MGGSAMVRRPVDAYTRGGDCRMDEVRVMKTIADELTMAIGAVAGRLVAPAIVAKAMREARTGGNGAGDGDHARVLDCLRRQMRLRLLGEREVNGCLEQCEAVLRRGGARSVGAAARRFAIGQDADIGSIRSVGKEMCRNVGFRTVDQVKVMTVISELARNAMQYAGGGTVELRQMDDAGRKGLEVVVRDQGAGIENVDRILSGEYRSKTGLGMGLRGSKNIMDLFEIRTSREDGTTVRVVKYL